MSQKSEKRDMGGSVRTHLRVVNALTSKEITHVTFSRNPKHQNAVNNSNRPCIRNKALAPQALQTKKGPRRRIGKKKDRHPFGSVMHLGCRSVNRACSGGIGVCGDAIDNRATQTEKIQRSTMHSESKYRAKKRVFEDGLLVLIRFRS
jgi:hypothetical protein